MDRPSRRIGRKKAGIALLLVGLALGLALVAVLPGSLAPVGASHGGVTPASSVVAAPTPAAGVHPSVASPVQIFLTVNTPVSTYTVLPFTMVLNLTVTNTTINTETTVLYLNITDYTTSTICGTNDLSSMITNSSIANSPVNTEYISFALTGSYFTSALSACPTLTSDQAFLNFSAAVTDPTNGSASAPGLQSGFEPITSVVFSTPTSLLNASPTAGQQQTYSFYANYTAQYVGKVTLSVFTPTGGLSFQASLRWNGSTPTVVNWHQTVSGSYPYTLSVSTAYGVYNTSGSIFVPALTPVYYNNATFHNTTLIPGLSSGAAGTLLLVVGLIVGMLVATVVSRLVWGGAKPAAAAQPWSQQAATGNVCSVCGKSFATPEELAAHSKSEHGMQ
jgi:hypothetical protein